MKILKTATKIVLSLFAVQLGFHFAPPPLSNAAPVTTTTIAFQGFESSASDTWTISAGSGNISAAAGEGDTPASQRIRTGTKSWQVSNETGTLILNPVSVVGYDDLTIIVRASSTSGTSGTSSNGADTADFIEFYVAVNGEVFSDSPDIYLKGYDNARWAYDASLTASTSAGNSITLQAPQKDFSANNYATFEITVPDATTLLALKIKAKNTTNEIWNIDDILIEGVDENVDYAPMVLITSPADGDLWQAVDSDISIMFSEVVNVASGWYAIGCNSSGTHSAVVSGTAPAASYTLNPATDFDPGEICTVTVDKTKVTGNDESAAPMAANYVFQFSTAATPSTSLVIWGVGFHTGQAEWVQIKNISTAAIDLADYAISDEETPGQGEGAEMLPDISLAAGETLTLRIRADDEGNWDYAAPAPTYCWSGCSLITYTLLTDYDAWATGGGNFTDDDEIILLQTNGGENDVNGTSDDVVLDAVCWGTGQRYVDMNANEIQDLGDYEILSDGCLSGATLGSYTRQTNTDTDTRADFADNPTAIRLVSFSARQGFALGWQWIGMPLLVAAGFARSFWRKNYSG